MQVKTENYGAYITPVTLYNNTSRNSNTSDCRSTIRGLVNSRVLCHSLTRNLTIGLFHINKSLLALI